MSAPERVAMIVEDDDVIRGLLATIVEDAGFIAVTVDTLPRARALLRELRPDILILDLYLRGEHASELLDELALADDAPSTMIVSASRTASKTAATFGLEYLPKPFELDQLDACLSRALEDNRRPLRAA